MSRTLRKSFEKCADRPRLCCINERIRSLISRGDSSVRIMNINVRMKSQCCADIRREQKANRKENANFQRKDKNQNILTHLAVNQAGTLLRSPLARSLSALSVCDLYACVVGSLVRHLFIFSYHVIFFAFSSYLLQSIQFLLRPFSSFCSFVRRVSSSSHIFHSSFSEITETCFALSYSSFEQSRIPHMNVDHFILRFVELCILIIFIIFFFP